MTKITALRSPTRRSLRIKQGTITCLVALVLSWWWFYQGEGDDRVPSLVLLGQNHNNPTSNSDGDPSGKEQQGLPQQQQQEEEEADKFSWVKEYQRDFPFTMEPSPGCGAALNDPSRLAAVAHVALKNWLLEQQQLQQQFHKGNALHPQQSATATTMTLSQAEQEWNAIMTACHGPIGIASSNDLVLANNLSLTSFWNGLTRCASPVIDRGGHPEVFGGEWCMFGWRDPSQKAFLNHTLHFRDTTHYVGDMEGDPREEVFITAARCALRMEFPIVKPTAALGTDSNAATTTIRQRRPGWKPQRVLLLSPTLGPKGSAMGCKLASTAYTRGWDVVFIEGKYKGLRYKYQDALAALELAVLDSHVSAHDTLVVFADSLDMLVQQTPEYVVEAFLDLDAEFSFSSENGCFPLGTWPHSLGVPRHTCEGRFPHSTDDAITPGHKYANTGGWMGTAASAFVVLRELSALVQQEGRDQPCFAYGTDQLLGNAAHLRAPSLIGLDTEFAVFAGSAWHLIGKELQLEEIAAASATATKKNRAYCKTGSSSSSSPQQQCPALLHFNGGGSEGGALDEAYRELTSSSTLQKCRNGQIYIANLDENRIWKESFKWNARWKTCRKQNVCTSSFFAF